MPARDPELADVLRGTFAKQVAFFRGKLGNLVPTATWRDVWQSAHDRAFMVAGAAKADLLADLASAVDKAIAEGETLEAFRRRFAEIVQRHGWHGWTGEKTPAGRAWRTRVIYETNLITSYAAGRAAQLKEGGYTWWIYKHSDFVQRPRPHHVALDGITRRADDPFWQTYYPPNGWGCRCRVVGARGPASIQRLGGDPSKTMPGWVGRIDQKTNAPVGVDQGFAYAPGATVIDEVRALSGRLDRLPSAPSIALIQSWLKASLFENWYAAPTGSFPLARLPDADALAIGAQAGVRTAHLSAETAIKQRERHPDLSSQDYMEVQATIDKATVRVLESQPTGTRDMIYVRADLPSGYVLVVKATLSGKNLYVKSFYRLHSDEALRDNEIGRLLRKGEKK